MTHEQLSALFFTPEYWAMRTSPHAVIHDVLNAEAQRRQRELEGLVTEVEVLQKRWSLGGCKIIVPDTNFFLHQKQRVWDMDWLAHQRSSTLVLLVVPWIVVHELDVLKRHSNTKTNARLSIKWLLGILGDDPAKRVRFDGGPETDPPVRGDTVYVEAFVDDPRHVPLPRADAEIVDRAQLVSSLSGRPVYIATGDAGMKLLARQAGLEVLLIEEPEPKN